MKTLTLIFSLCLVIFLAGCGSADKPAANTVKTEPAATSKSDTTTSSAGTGVASCDEYLAKLDKFVNNPKVPQVTRDAFKQTLEQNRTAWKQAASTPQGKAGLETGCKMALDAAKSTLDQYDK